MKRLYRYRRRENGAILGGVSVGMAEYFNIDVSLIRLIWVALILTGPLILLVYVIAWIIIPARDEHQDPFPR